MMYSCRDIYKSEFGYKRWENFNDVIKQVLQLHKSGIIDVDISKTTKTVEIGRHAKRDIVDYVIDDRTKNVILSFCPNKIHRVKPVRNETVVMGLLEKYFNAKGIEFEFQKHIGDYVADALVGGKIIIEHDEPYHTKVTIKKRDSKKDAFYTENGYKIFRCETDDDVVDIIIGIEKLYENDNVLYNKIN